MILPQITYNDFDAVSNPNGGPQTLDFVFPPTTKPKMSSKATRNDTFSTAGNRQTVLQRVDQQWPITMSNILDDGSGQSDADNWQRFLDYAVQGGPFQYLPDASDADAQYTVFLVETDAQLAYSSPGVFSFTGTFQKEIQ